MYRKGDNGSQPGPDSGDIRETQKILAAFLSLFKASTLYPADHSISRDNLAKFHELLAAFLQDHGSLRLHTRKNDIYYMEERIFTGRAEEMNPAYILARDGLEYIEFLAGITREEIADLVDILIRYRNPFEDREGDTVTALWQKNFTHILYQEVDIFALESFEFDLTGFSVTPDEQGEAAAGRELNRSSMGASAGKMEQAVLAAENLEQSSMQEDARQISPEPISRAVQNRLLSEQGAELMTLTPEEKNLLAEHVRAEENTDVASDVIDVLLVILVTQKNREDFTSILEFLEFEFFHTMERAEFHLAFKLLHNLQIIRKQLNSWRSWSIPLLDDFVASLSEPEKFSQIRWLQEEDPDWTRSPYLEHLWQVLQMLSPRVILSLAPLLPRLPADREGAEMLALIEIMAKRDPRVLDRLLLESGQKLILLLAPILEALPPEDAAAVYLGLTRHDSAEVRTIGLDGYIRTAPLPDFDRLYHLLGDASPLLRNRVINYLLGAGEKSAAPLLVRFLSDAPAVSRLDAQTIIRHYKALASCASVDCLPFLEKKLLGSGLMSLLGSSGSLHREGAALALRKLGTPEALAILEKGARSLKPDIRSASRKALED